MMLRPRVVVTSLIAAVPAAMFITWMSERARAKELEVAVTRFVTSQINDQVRERCESDPAWFLAGPLVGRPPGGVFVPAHEDDLPPRPRVELRPFELFAYDDRFVGSGPATPRMAEEMRNALRTQRVATPVVAPHVTEAGTGVQVAVATTWMDGPCAYFVARLEAAPNQRRDRWLFASGVFLSLLLVALAAAAPMVLRVRRLARDARRAVDDNHAAIAPDRLRDELSSLTFVFNDASQAIHERDTRIDDLNDALKRFVQSTEADIAQPLATLEGTVARAGESPQRADAALREVHQLSAKAGNLAAAARLRTSVPLSRTNVDLGALVAAVVERYGPISRSGGVTLRFSPPAETIAVIGEAALIDRAIANLVDNAVRYASPGVSVQLLLERAAGQRFSLRVLDTGPGVSEEHLRTLTAVRRFRGDEGRNRRPGAPGLGLAVALEVCDRHGLALELRRRTEGGFEAEISGPVAG
jgi:signal transduction histidine kinase